MMLKVFIMLWITFGLGFYAWMSLKSLRSFRGATTAEVILGLIFCIPLWPIGLFFQVYNAWDKWEFNNMNKAWLKEYLTEARALSQKLYHLDDDLSEEERKDLVEKLIDVLGEMDEEINN